VRVDITDPNDPSIDDYRELKDATRRRSGTFIAESELVISRLLTSEFVVRSFLLTPSRYARLSSQLPADLPAFVAEESVLNELVGFPLHRGALALGERPSASKPVAQLTQSARTIVLLEDVVDPDNVGAVFRHSAAFGVDAVLISPHAGDPLYRKAIRAAVGWSLHVPWTRVPEGPIGIRSTEGSWPSTINDLRADGWQVLALTPDAEAPVMAKCIEALGPHAKVALMVGTEHIGLTQQSMEAATVRARIPMASGVDSLNVATTVAIALYELAQRAR
jgi:tRNA G18 (ribose-2'-O)-methylase SpoU